MSKKPTSPIFCVLLYNTFPNYVILYKIFEGKEDALAFGQDLWANVHSNELKNIMVIVTICENPKDFDHTYGEFVKVFYVPRNEEVKAYEIEYLYDLRRLNGFIHAYDENDARMIFSKRTRLNLDSIISIKEMDRDFR